MIWTSLQGFSPIVFIDLILKIGPETPGKIWVLEFWIWNFTFSYLFFRPMMKNVTNRWSFSRNSLNF